MQNVELPNDECYTNTANFDFTCDKCGIDQKTFAQTLRHYTKQHKIEGYIKCCGRKFNTEAKITDHIAWHKNPDVFKYVHKFNVSTRLSIQ